MSKLIYHTGTGTYFSLDDDCVIIETDDVPGFDAEVMDHSGDYIADKIGKPFHDVYTASDPKETAP